MNGSLRLSVRFRGVKAAAGFVRSGLIPNRDSIPPASIPEPTSPLGHVENPRPTTLPF
jgi:hypothetical protein